MKNYPIIHEYTDLTKEDLVDFARRTSKILTDAAINRYPSKDFETKDYIMFKMNIDWLGIMLMCFGMAAIENRRFLQSKSIKGQLYVLKHLYPHTYPSIIKSMLGIFQSYYDCIKKGLLELECYEMIIPLDRKFKTIQKIFNEEIKSLT